MPIAPTIATGRSCAAPSRISPTVSISAAPTAQRAAPMRSGRPPPTSRVATTVAGEDAEDRRRRARCPRWSRLRTMNAETAAKPTTLSAKVAAGPERLAGDERPAVDVLAAPVEALGQPGGDHRAEQRSAGGEGPDEVVAAGVLEQHPDRRPEGEAGPDREPVEADHPAPPLLRRHVDVPGRAGGEHRALAGARGRGARRSAPGSWPAGSSRQPAIAASRAPTITVGLRPRRSARLPAIGRQTIPVKAKAPVTIPTSRSEPLQLVLDVVGQDRQGRADRQQPEVGDDEDPGEARPRPSASSWPRSSARLILPLERLRQLLGELDDPRVLVGRGDALHVLLQLCWRVGRRARRPPARRSRGPPSRARRPAPRPRRPPPRRDGRPGRTRPRRGRPGSRR